jgi:nucleoside-diphosphate-sugar epimerase
MASRLVRVFSSATNLEELGDEPFVVTRQVVERRHLLDGGADFFDEQDKPVRPPPQTLKKAFSGSMLDLDEAVEPVEASNNNNNNNNGNSDNNNNNQNELSDDYLNVEGKGTVGIVGGVPFLNGHLVSQLLEKGFSVTVFLNDIRGINRGLAAEYVAISLSKNNNNLTAEQQSEKYTNFSGKSTTGAGAGATAGPSTTRQPNYATRLVMEECDMYDANALRESIKRSNCRFLIHGGVSGNNSSNIGGGVLTGQKLIEMHTSAVRALFEAVRGLRSGSSTLTRIVVTSSTSAVASNADACPSATGFTEDCVNTKSTAAAEPFVFAKAHFEAEVWRLAKGTASVDVSVIIPTIMIGPSRTSESSEAMRLVHDFASSSSLFPLAPDLYWNFVDVRDVALAHVLALESPAASNRRFIVSAANLNLAGLGRLIRQANSNLKAPVYSMPWALAMLSPLFPGTRAKMSVSQLWNTLGVRRPFSTKRAESELGINFRPIAETVRDGIGDLSEQGKLPEASGAISADWEATRSVLLGTVVAGLGTAAVWWYKNRYNNNKRIAQKK